MPIPYKVVCRRLDVGGQVGASTERLADQCSICGKVGGTTYFAETDTMVCPAFIELYDDPGIPSWEALLAAHRQAEALAAPQAERETTPYRCKRCRARYHLADLVERDSGAQTWLLCPRCAPCHDAWAPRTAAQAELLQACASAPEAPRP